MPPPAVIGTIVGKIPAEEDAAFVAQVGERGRITSRGGSVEISSAALTADAMDALNATIFPPAQLRALDETGVAQFDFSLPGIDGTFTALAGSIAGDRWLEIRRRSAATPARVHLAAEPTAAQAIAGLDDLTEPASSEFPERNMDSFLDGLKLSEDVLEGPAIGAPNEPADEGRREIDRIEIAAADSAPARPLVDPRPRLRGLFRVALPVAMCLLAALMAGYFNATRRPSASRNSAARSSAAALTPPPPVRASAAPLKAPAPRPETPAAAMPQATSPTQAATSSAPTAPTVRSDEQSRCGFSVQVAAVRTRDEADRLVTRFVNQGYPAYLVRGEGAAANFYRVRIGTFADRQAAEEVARQLEGTEGVKPWIATEIPENKTAASSPSLPAGR